MGTKNQPGVYDCYSKLEPDEPHFVIMGRDPSAALLITLWATLREAQGEDEAKTGEARQCAAACYQYARELGKQDAMEQVNRVWELYLEDATK
jgi:hypothetical protein